MLENPFAILERRLNRLESLLLDIKESQAPTIHTHSAIDKPLTIKEAAALVNLAVPTLYSMVSHKTIPYFKKGKRLYFSKQELLDWVKSGRRQTQTEIEAEADAELAAIGRRGR